MHKPVGQAQFVVFQCLFVFQIAKNKLDFFKEDRRKNFNFHFSISNLSDHFSSLLPWPAWFLV